MFLSELRILKIYVLTRSDPSLYGSHRWNAIGNSDSRLCLYTCASAHQKSYFFPIVSKNDSQLQSLSLNHFWFSFLAYIHLPSCIYAHYDIFQSPSGIWNRHEILYWLERMQEKFLPVRKNVHIHFFSLANAWQQGKQRNVLIFNKTSRKAIAFISTAHIGLLLIYLWSDFALLSSY